MSININYEEERKRANLFSERKITVHVSKLDGLWFNGLILEVGFDFFIILDREEKKNQYIFFSELKTPLEVFKDLKEQKEIEG